MLLVLQVLLVLPVLVLLVLPVLVLLVLPVLDLAVLCDRHRARQKVSATVAPEQLADGFARPVLQDHCLQDAAGPGIAWGHDVKDS